MAEVEEGRQGRKMMPDDSPASQKHTPDVSSHYCSKRTIWTWAYHRSSLSKETRFFGGFLTLLSPSNLLRGKFGNLCMDIDVTLCYFAQWGVPNLFQFVDFHCLNCSISLCIWKKWVFQKGGSPRFSGSTANLMGRPWHGKGQLIQVAQIRLHSEGKQSSQSDPRENNGSIWHKKC